MRIESPVDIANTVLCFFALSFPASDAKRIEPLRFASEKSAQKSIVRHMRFESEKLAPKE
jgi:hypothetical protein